MPTMTNWKQVVADIRARDFTVAEIAEECGSTRNAVSDIAHGDTLEPRHALGEALLALHKRVMRRKA